MGTLRTRWSALSRPRRAALMAGAAFVAVAVAGVGAGVAGGSGHHTPAPVVWRDHVADPTPTTLPS